MNWHCQKSKNFDDRMYCPPDGCPMKIVKGGVTVPYGCARDHGWRPGDPSPPEVRGIYTEDVLTAQGFGP